MHGYKNMENAGRDISLTDIINILIRRKYLIIASVAIAVLAAFAYNQVAKPVYQASVLIKKEKNYNDRMPDEFNKIVQMQTYDEIETEMEVLKTSTVLEKVVKGLQLNVTINEVILGEETLMEENLLLAEYNAHKNKMESEYLPQILFQSRDSDTFSASSAYCIHLAEDGTLELLNAESGAVIAVAEKSEPIFEVPTFHLIIDWAKAVPGSRIYFEVANVELTALSLGKELSVSPLSKTSLFKVTAFSHSPYIAQLIANTMIEKFREARYEHKRQTVRYSATFVDSQLSDISNNLSSAEKKLSRFRSDHQITEISETLREANDFLNKLETEKVNNDLKLAEYGSRLMALDKEYQEKGFFDQTYLTPSQFSENSSPFARSLQELSAAELECLALLQKRMKDHPDVKAAEARIEKIRKSLSAYNMNTLTAYRVIIQSLEIKHNNLQAMIDQYMARIADLLDKEVELADLNRQRNAYEEMYTLLLNKREEMRVAEFSRLQDIVIVEGAKRPFKAIAPRKTFNLLVGFILGLAIGIFLVIIAEFLSGTLQNVSEVESTFGLPVLGVLPKYNKTIHKRVNKAFTMKNHLSLISNGYGEIYRTIRTKLNMILPGRNLIQFVSCEAKTGRTSVTANLAVSLAVSGKKVLVIDCDLNDSKIGEYFELPESASGITDFLTDADATVPKIHVPHKKVNGQQVTLNVVPAGRKIQNVNELLDSVKVKNFLENAASLYDYVLVDTPAANQTADSLILGGFIQDVIMVVQPDLTRKDILAGVIEHYRQYNINIAGCVVNGCSASRVPIHLPHKKENAAQTVSAHFNADDNQL